ncbi:gene transfer agent family protein [Aestuariivita boseongensis]|uniref:gene transfer agent family protein n=1 Tax=Aestuariivita boseongensis TaxID=1470562 RepID=UPI000682BE0F|nr:gene transfer agent family protein [Aestuariivita boseongensis]
MANPWSGEVTLTIDGKPRLLRLTLGALAALEARLQTGSLVALVERFESGGFSAADVLALLEAALVGGGNPMEAEQLAQAEIDGGPIGAARAAAAVLAGAFIVPGETA